MVPKADNSLSKGPIQLEIKGRTPRKPVYVYSRDGLTLINKYDSLRAAVKGLHGDRNKNTKMLQLRIEHKELYHGFRVSYEPLTGENNLDKSVPLH